MNKTDYPEGTFVESIERLKLLLQLFEANPKKIFLDRIQPIMYYSLGPNKRNVRLETVTRIEKRKFGKIEKRDRKLEARFLRSPKNQIFNPKLVVCRHLAFIFGLIPSQYFII